MLLLSFVGYAAAFSLLPWIMNFLPEPPPVVEGYRGLLIEASKEALQRGEAACGHASLAYLLSVFLSPCSEEEVAASLGKTGWLSFANMTVYLTERGLRWQALEVGPDYFRENPQPGIIHVDGGHFIVFLRFDVRGDALVFDPARGLVLMDWNALVDIWDGYYLYVYA